MCNVTRIRFQQHLADARRAALEYIQAEVDKALKPFIGKKPDITAGMRDITAEVLTGRLRPVDFRPAPACP